jgi:hypothetical protein
MNDEALRALLLRSGYTVRMRHGEWAECLLLQGEEAWLGRGADAHQALLAAVRAACPSQLAMELLTATLAAPVATPLPRTSASPPIAVPAACADPSEEVTVRRSEEEARVPQRARARPSGPPPLVRRDTVPDPIDVPRALEELALLMDRVRDTREELGLCSPERQRLTILTWICEARGHTDLFPENARIRDEVSVLSRQLTELGKSFWPGSVTALQLQMTPRDLPKHVLGGCASTWTRAAELAERQLSSVEYADERRGWDVHGWADEATLAPGPSDPSAELARLLREVEAFSGTLERAAETRDPERRPEGQKYLEWVRRLRWLRRADVEPDPWARLAGRLRWWAGRRDPELVAGARELEPAYAPPRPWSEVLQEAPRISSAEGGSIPGALPAEALAEVARLLAGKRLMLVSPRRDPEQLEQLSRLLEGVTLEWRLAELRRLEELAEVIQGGDFHVVLGATGFASGSVDHLIARAARRAGARYFRVNRGRPGACLRSLARGLGRLP